MKMNKLFAVLLLPFMATSEEYGCRKILTTITCMSDYLKIDEPLDINSTYVDFFSSAGPMENLQVTFSKGSMGIKTFSQAVGAKRLFISYSDITEIEDGTFCSIPTLRSINIGPNNVGRDNVPIKGPPPLTESILNNCQNLESLHLEDQEFQPSAFKYLTNLKELTIYGAKILHLTDEYLRTLKDLRILTIYRSEIVRVDPNVFCLSPRLQKLTIIGNILPTPDGSWFEKCHSVKELTLAISQNNSKGIKDNTFNNFISLRKLKGINLNANHLTNAYLKNLADLRELRLIYSNIETIDSDAFSDLTNLMVLEIYFNQLKEINAAAFKNLTKLTDMSLTKNHLTSIDNLKVPQLKNLIVEQNLIEEINVTKLRSNLPNLRNISVNHNRLKCDYKVQLHHDLQNVGVNLKLTVVQGNATDCIENIK